jgi:hypothetical protein
MEWLFGADRLDDQPSSEINGDDSDEDKAENDNR